jgi:hypothetical protein
MRVYTSQPCLSNVIVITCTFVDEERFLASSATERGEKALSNEPLAMKNDEGETEKMNQQHFPVSKSEKGK